MIAAALSYGSSPGDLWQGLRPPLIQWHPSRKVNGFARLLNADQPQIVATLGVHARVHEFAYRLFSTQDLCRDVGNATVERGVFADLARDSRWSREPDTPRCPIREQAVFITAECAIALIFFHEAGHVALGHLTQSGAPASYQERTERRWWQSLRSPTPQQLKTARARQRDELLADRFALATAFHHLRTSGGAFPNQIVPPELKPVLPSLLLVSQVALHLVLAETQRSVAEFDACVHPHPMTRLLDGVGSLIRGGLLRDIGPAAQAADAFRLASAMRREPLSAQRFDALQRAARVQLDAIHRDQSSASS